MFKIISIYVSVSSIKFAHNEKHLLACSSKDRTLSVCTLNPPKVQFMLLGHKQPVNGKAAFFENLVLNVVFQSIAF